MFYNKIGFGFKSPDSGISSTCPFLSFQLIHNFPRKKTATFNFPIYSKSILKSPIVLQILIITIAFGLLALIDTKKERDSKRV